MTGEFISIDIIKHQRASRAETASISYRDM
jgi:hypothetical protein